MANLAVWLMSMVVPVLKRVLLTLGIGTITYSAITPLVNSVISNVQTNYGAIPASIAQFLNIVGAGTAFGIIAGALVARVSFMVMSRLGKVV